jgi:alkanesulfonate monooxygenase SsuD/methylene tetrahydromethanopterin reductase-like flavin-dependent oxidoreductase (luciferase family)
VCTAAEADDRVRFARDCAGERADKLEWHTLIQVVKVTGDRRKAAAEMAEEYRGTMTAEQILETPFLFVGTIEEMAEQIIRNRDRYGFTYYTVHEPYLDDFAPVIDRVRAL